MMRQAANAAAAAAVVERRRHHRQASTLRLRLSGVDAGGAPFTLESELKDISSGGCYVRLASRVEPGSPVSAVIELGPHETGAQPLSLRGRVLRCEPLIDTRCGVAVEFIGPEQFGGHN